MANPLDNRFNDLNRQGFMKIGRGKPRKVKAPRPWVACDRCRDWHPKGKHTKRAGA